MSYNVEPQGLIYLCKTPLENDYMHQLDFANATSQLNYFASTVVKTYDNNTYIRKDGGIKLNVNIEEIRGCNYLYFKNTGFTNKYFYCFITSMTYLNENATLITYETDCFQTWCFDLVYKPCFVEREHVIDDTPGKHTVDEGIEYGDYVIHSRDTFKLTDDTTGGWYVAIQFTQPPYDGAPISFISHRLGGTFSGLYMIGCTMDDAATIIEMYENSSLTISEALINIYMIPKEHVLTATSQTWNDGTRSATVYNISDVQSLGTDSYIEPGVIGGTYAPKNNKLLVYPYSYFHITNNAGQDIEYHWEDFPLSASSQRTATFTAWSTPIPGCAIKLIPETYRNYTDSGGDNDELMNYGVTGAKLPICAWINDYYLNWNTQMGVNNAIGAVAGLATTTVGALSGNLLGAMGGLAGVLNAVQQAHKAVTTPPQAEGDTNGGDLTFGIQRNAFNIYKMTIRDEYARIIDEYFSMYGYKINRVKTPSITGRSQWNFVKTISCNVEGDIPQEDLQVIRAMFNKGVTFWHNPANIYNYNLTNSIVV